MATRESWVYPSDGSEPYLKGTGKSPQARTSGLFMHGDLPDFVSPVDGKHYSGRAGLREHNLRNNVVPMEDVKGLPPLMTNSDIRSPEQRQAYADNRKRHIINEVYKHVRD